MTESKRAVFLSYASEDAAAAARICARLRGAGIEVWFDQSELRGGDAWDGAIRKQIKTCTLFIPVISANTHARVEGYFRLEWKLAIDRSYLIAPDQAFLLPVVIDDTTLADERIPDRFRELHWTQLPAGDTPAAFVDRVLRLTAPDERFAHVAGRLLSNGAPSTAVAPRLPARTALVSWLSKAALAVSTAAVVIALGYVAVERFRQSKRPTAVEPTTTSALHPTAPAPSTVLEKSIAVLPFVDMSEKKDQEYFSDGLSEELIDHLAHSTDLKVIARTSSFQFKGRSEDVRSIAAKLSVANLLEGSVRKAGSDLRITVQLIRASDGTHLWSQTYERKLKDIFKVQEEIAATVARALNIALNAQTQRVLAREPTAAAYDAYLRGTQLFSEAEDDAQWHAVLNFFDKAIALDPTFAAAYARRAWSIINAADWHITDAVRADARQSAERAVSLAPNLGDAHLALGFVLEIGYFDMSGAEREFNRALALAPGSAEVQRSFAGFSANLGHFETAVAAARHAVILDPQSYRSRWILVRVLVFARRFGDALAAIKEGTAIKPDGRAFGPYRATIYLMLDQPEIASKTCESASIPIAAADREWCLALAYHALGKFSEAATRLDSLRKSVANTSPYTIAQVYAQWGQTNDALGWLATAEQQRDAALTFLKVDPLLDPIRNELAFERLKRRLDFPL